MKNSLSLSLKQARIAAGYSQEEAAHLLGVRRSTIGNYESGRSQPNLERFVRLCNFYQVDFTRLAARLYATSPLQNASRKTLLEAIMDHLSSLSTELLQKIEWIFSRRHAAELFPLIQVIDLYLHLRTSTQAHCLEWLLGCYSLQQGDSLPSSAGATSPDMQAIQKALRELSE